MHRNGFVTNSSSSSFIVKNKNQLQIPEKYQHILKLISNSKEAIDVLYDMTGSFDMDINEDTLKTKYHFTDEQLNMLKAVYIGEEKAYDEIVSALSDSYFVYYLYVDRDWLFGQYELQELIDSCNTIAFSTE